MVVGDIFFKCLLTHVRRRMYWCVLCLRGSSSPENTFKFIRPEPLKEIRVLLVVRYLFEFLQFFVQVLRFGT